MMQERFIALLLFNEKKEMELVDLKWSEVSVHTTQEAVEPVCHILHEAGASGVVIEDPADLVKLWGVHYGEVYQLSPDDYPEEGVIIKAYFPVNAQFEEKVAEIKASITNLREYGIEIGHNKVTLHEVVEEEWATAWKKYYKPIRITESITITPSWEEYEPESADECIIELDPGMAFGTGTHPTTILCIRALEKVIQSGDTVIDVGTGSGVLSIAAVKLGSEKVLALDLDEVAVNSALENIKLNGVAEQVSIKQNDLLKGIDTACDIVVANILAEVIVSFVQDVARVLKDDGTFIASGIISRKRAEVEVAMQAHGLQISEVMEMEDWVAIIAKKV